MPAAGAGWTLWAALCCCALAAAPEHPRRHGPHGDARAEERRCARPEAELAALAPGAPVVLEAKARSASSDRRANLSVTFEVKRALRASGGRPLAGEHVRLQVARGGCWGAPRAGRLYLLLAERAPGPGPARALRLLAPPAPRSRRLAQRLRALLRPHSGAAARPPGAVGLRDQRARAGERVRLSCRARGRPPPALAWFKDGRPLAAGPQRRIRLQTKKRRSMLVISHARLEDSGRYECRALAPHARPAASRAHLSVQPDPRNDSSTVWGGAPCPMPGPISYCLNGGTCLYFEAVGEAACKCSEGFNGQRCENKDVSNRSSDEDMSWSMEATSDILLQDDD